MAQVLENDLLTGYEAQQLRARAEVARKQLTGQGEGSIVQVHVLDDDGNVDFNEDNDAYNALVPIFFRWGCDRLIYLLFYYSVPKIISIIDI